jgi:hypothetical protein
VVEPPAVAQTTAEAESFLAIKVEYLSQNLTAE